MAAAALPLGPVPAGIKGVQQGGKAVEALPLHTAAVLADGHEAEIPGPILIKKHIGRKFPVGNGIVQGVKLLRQGLKAAAAAEGQLPADQGRKTGEIVQQPLVHRNLPVRAVRKGPPCLAVGGEEIPLVLLGRQAVDHSRQQPSFRVTRKVHAAHTVDDPAVSAHKDHVCASADHLHRQPFPGQVAHLVSCIQIEHQHTLMLRLLQSGDARAHKMLAQQHTEHGRLRRVFHALPGEMHPGIPGPRRDKQAGISASAPQGQDQHVPFRLLHLVNLCALQLFPQFGGQCAEAYGVKRHFTPPP